ncbi:Neuritin-like protein [Liparis tanakae]|uniref:Neuritin-like protein n=1 Tax=Liparis tanakae TaxID=230148 RepID=A0A4Z2HH89_9TELE|nr:Neuritin-like protein [Liparis tanakae]
MNSRVPELPNSAAALPCLFDPMMATDERFRKSLKSWDEFHDCANAAMAGCPNEAAAVWESLRQESKKMQFSGNLYDMCSNREDHAAAAAAASVSPRGSLEINQESLKGRADQPAPIARLLVLLAPLLLLLCWM